MGSLLGLPCPAWGQMQGVRLHCLRPLLTTYASWLLQMGGGARQAHEPADHGGHAAGGKSPQRSGPGEVHGRIMWPKGTVFRGAKLAALCDLLLPQSLLEGAKRPLLRPLQGPVQCCRKSLVEELGSLGPRPGTALAFRGTWG